MSESDEIAVIASSLHREYHIGDITIEALQGLDLEVAEGEFVTIHGPSGAGKTTLLNIIGGLDKPTSGKVVVFGHNLLACDEDFLATFRCAYIGFVFQSYNLISTLTAIENVAFPREIAGWEEKRVAGKAEKLLEIVGLSHRRNHFPSQLSARARARTAKSGIRSGFSQ